jgi:hypothetical protein
MRDVEYTDADVLHDEHLGAIEKEEQKNEWT